MQISEEDSQQILLLENTTHVPGMTNKHLQNLTVVLLVIFEPL